MRRPHQRIATSLLLPAALVLAPRTASAAGGLELFPDLEILVALLLLFAALIVPVNALLFRPIFRVLDARDEKISGTRRRAEKLAADTEEILSRYEASVLETREQAERDRKQRVAEARAENSAQTASARGEAEREIASAREQIGQALVEARVSLRQEAERLAGEAAARVLGRPLS